jgi:1-aminocyclopropane-1-carboxylate deaminase/D-cysteine desulfhydrase-like pyridoxal-dependent ACC family enzyme
MIMMNRMNDESYRTLAMLRYQAEHYRLVGNGSMSQQINAEIRRLENSGRKITETQKN